VLREVQNFSCFAFVSKTVEHIFHIELSLEIKIYIFFEIFCYFLDGYKSLVLDGVEIVRSVNFVPI
jgi:hypothetical protein